MKLEQLSQDVCAKCGVSVLAKKGSRVQEAEVAVGWGAQGRLPRSGFHSGTQRFQEGITLGMWGVQQMD